MRSDKTTCEYCGKTKEGLSFVIGASNKPDWCMIEGTGKITCPECYLVASEEGQEAIEKHIRQVKEMNNRVKGKQTERGGLRHERSIKI